MESPVATAVNGDVEYYRKMLRNGGTMPRMEEPSAAAQVVAPVRTKSNVKTPATTARFKTMNEFVDFSARLVDTTAQAVWLVLFRETKPNGIACVSHSQIADRIGSSRRTVVRAVQHLEDAKLITVVHRGGLTGGTSSYRVHGTPQGCDARVTPTSATSVTGGVTKPVNPA